jgi:hypothetical protein
MNQPFQREKRHSVAPTPRRALRVDPLLAVPLDRCVARCTGGKGCTWGPCAGDVRGARAPGMYVGPVRRGCTWGPRAGDVRGARAPGMYVGPVRRGCTWGPRAGGLSRPRQRPPAIISAPLSGLEHEGVGLSLARRPSGPKRRRARAVSIHPTVPAANPRKEQGRSSPDRGAPTRSRWAQARTRQAPGARAPRTSPAHGPHGHPAPYARAPRTFRSRRASPTYLPPPARVPHVHPAPGARAPRTSPVRAPHVPPAPYARAGGWGPYAALQPTSKGPTG